MPSRRRSDNILFGVMMFEPSWKKANAVWGKRLKS
jgi:hypothetical protein